MYKITNLLHDFLYGVYLRVCPMCLLWHEWEAWGSAAMRAFAVRDVPMLTACHEMRMVVCSAIARRCARVPS